ncbi:Fucosyltransferase [Heracleum sosnowskyi]|uniref:Fucosyltransferase n=1 Tax=Heracleum sosnowskyi TaxID=360622 RepID=A0AAD8H161_9APIA|nr:Fucosyltransferase [Heracleum sosnowskyi]
MKRHNRSSNGVVDRSDPHNDLESRVVENDEFKYGLDPLKVMGIFVVCLMGLSVFFSFSLILKDSTSHSLWAVAEARPIDDFNPQLHTVTSVESVESDSSHLFEAWNNEVLGGLLPGGFDAKSCLSRHHSGSYRKESQFKPSSYLLSRLRRYESHLKRCGPHTMSYNKTVEKLKAGKQLNPSESDCKYVVWISYSGLGNRILTLASAFLYALLTNRVLLVDRGADMVDLFCEPFPETSWLLPLDFPVTNQFNKFDQSSPHSYGNRVKNATLDSDIPFLYLHLAHDYGDHDKLFFCEQDQAAFQNIDWLIIKTDNYFIPSLFLIPSFEQELNSLFPEKETVFHFLGRYLFYPTNSIWGLVTRFYEAYLAKADEKIGIQIRVFDTGVGPFQHVLDQILACTMKENLLPKVDEDNQIIIPSTNQKTKAVLMTSLSSGYLDKVRDIYWEHPTVTGEIIGVYQPSHEEYQQTEKKMQNKKAWAEMYLLSLTDKLVTSSWSTFGYVAQGLGGLKPWILYKPENATAPDPPCRRAMSMEPCFHAPPFYDCKKKTGIDTGAVVPHVRHCEDMSWGLKLVDHVNDL